MGCLKPSCNVRQPANATANGSQGVRARDAAGVTPEMSLCLSAASRRKSHSTCMPCQNWSDWPKKAPKRIDMAGVIERLPCTISLIALGETPMARDMAFCEIPMGVRYSWRRISPGVMGGCMVIMYDVTGVLSMVIDNADMFRAKVCPAEHNTPAVVDADGMGPGKIATETFQVIAGCG